jgi:transposase
MISKNKIKKETERIKKLNKEEGRKEIKKLSKLIKLNKNVKFVLSMQSHYRFKEYLKAKEYKTNVYDADESYTSMTWTKCGDQSKEYDKQRIKQCKCGYKIDRDCNGSRNILLKCLKSLILVW